MNPWTGRASLYGFQSNSTSAPMFNSDENNGYTTLKVQGILGLYDCSENEGGLHGVPGFHHDMAQWAKDHEDLKQDRIYPKSIDETTVQVPKQDAMRDYVTKLPYAFECFLTMK